jgi:hypothetical protein
MPRQTLVDRQRFRADDGPQSWVLDLVELGLHPTFPGATIVVEPGPGKTIDDPCHVLLVGEDSPDGSLWREVFRFEPEHAASSTSGPRRLERWVRMTVTPYDDVLVTLVREG